MRNSTEGDEKRAYPGYSLMAELTGFSDRLDVGSDRRSGVEETAHFFFFLFWPEQQEASMRRLNAKSSAQCLACSWCLIDY